jgi:calcineurin-like phosphoesterase family protein
MLYFTADTHFFHSNIINLCSRPFNNLENMHKKLIQNWNSCVTNRDEIYILGDFIFKGSGLEANQLLKKLNGRKYLIKGNHDKFFDDPEFDKTLFEWIKEYYVLNYEKMK